MYVIAAKDKENKHWYFVSFSYTLLAARIKLPYYRKKYGNVKIKRYKEYRK